MRKARDHPDLRAVAPLPPIGRWASSASPGREIDFPDKGRTEDAAEELKRLRRENAILRQERDILKRATAFFAKEGSR